MLTLGKTTVGMGTESELSLLDTTNTKRFVNYLIRY